MNKQQTKRAWIGVLTSDEQMKPDEASGAFFPFVPKKGCDASYKDKHSDIWWPAALQDQNNPSLIVVVAQ